MATKIPKPKAVKVSTKKAPVVKKVTAPKSAPKASTMKGKVVKSAKAPKMMKMPKKAAAGPKQTGGKFKKAAYAKAKKSAFGM